MKHLFLMYNILSIASKNVKRNPIRSLIIILSAILLSFLISFIYLSVITVDKNIKLVNEKLGADLIVLPKGSKSSFDKFLFARQLTTFYMKKDIYYKIKEEFGDKIDKITYQVFLVTLPALCCGVADVQVIAIDPKTDFIVKPFLEKKVELKPGTAYAGIFAWYYILGFEVDTAYLYGKEYDLITNLIETGTGLDYSLFISIDELKDIIGKNPYVVAKKDDISVIYIKLKPNVDLNEFANELREKIKGISIIKKGELGMSVRESIVSISKSLMLVLFTIVPLFLLIIFVMIYISIIERRKEIGIYKAIGVKNSSIFKLIIYELLLLIIPAIIVGIIMALLLSINVLPKILYTFKLIFGKELFLSFLISFLATMLSSITGAYFSLMKNVLKSETLNLIKEE